MEPRGSLSHSQKPATCPHPETDQSSLHPPSHFLNMHCNIILTAKSWSFKLFLSLTFPHQNRVSCTCSTWANTSNNNRWIFVRITDEFLHMYRVSTMITCSPARGLRVYIIKHSQWFYLIKIQYKIYIIYSDTIYILLDILDYNSSYMFRPNLEPSSG